MLNFIYIYVYRHEMINFIKIIQLIVYGKIQHFRSCHASVFIMSKRCIEKHTNDDESEPAIKKLHPDRSFTQLRLNKFFPGPATEVYTCRLYASTE